MKAMNLLIGITDEINAVAFWSFDEEVRRTLKEHGISVLTFGAKETDIVVDALSQNYDELASQLKSRNFVPDLALIITVGYGLLLEGIERAPFPLALLYLEWFFTAQNLYLTSLRVDHIFAVLESSKEDVKRITGKDPLITSLPLMGDRFPQFHPLPEVEKAYDVVYIGNCNPVAHPERTRFFERLALLPEKYKVLIGQTRTPDNKSVILEETNRVNNQARIGINFSQPYMKAVGTRVAHTLMSGTFLLTEHMMDEKDFLADGKNCGFYDPDNLEAKIAYYLAHEEERETMAKNGLKHAENGAFFFTKTLLKMLDKLKSRLESPFKNNRGFIALPEYKQLTYLGMQAMFSKTITESRGFVKGVQYFEKAYHKESNSAETSNNLGVSYAACYLFGLDLSDAQKGNFKGNALGLFRQVQRISKNDILSRFNLACLYWQEKDFKSFSQLFIEINGLFEELEEGWESLFPYSGLLLMYFFDFYSIKRWQELFFQYCHDGKPVKEFYIGVKRYVLWILNEWMGELLTHQEKHEAAAEHYREASTYMPDADRTMEELGRSLLKAGKNVEAKAAFEKSIALNPLNATSALAICEIELNLGNRDRAKQIARKYQLISERISIFGSALEHFKRVLASAS